MMKNAPNKHSGFIAALALILLAPAYGATATPTFQSVVPSGPNFQFNYSLNFTPSAGEVLAQGSFFTIYDIPGLVSATSAAGFSVSAANTGLTPAGVAPPDHPGIINISFTYLGAPVSTPTSFSGFNIVSTFGSLATGTFSSQHNLATGAPFPEVGPVTIPAAPSVPDGGQSLWLVGLTMTALAGLSRLAHRFRSVA